MHKLPDNYLTAITMDVIYPLISCICITDNRITLLKKAVNYFRNQDYQHKELVVSIPQKDKLSRYVIHKIAGEMNINLILLIRPNDELLGIARNKAIANCNGEYICTWDDDDWYHPQRLSVQYEQMISEGLSASILNSVLLFDQTRQQAYTSFLYTWENTLLCQKQLLLQNKYLEKGIGEDTKIIEFLDNKKVLCHIWNVPYLYIYVYHRGNVWAHSHFSYLFKRSELLNQQLSLQIGRLLDE